MPEYKGEPTILRGVGGSGFKSSLQRCWLPWTTQLRWGLGALRLPEIYTAVERYAILLSAHSLAEDSL